MDLDCILVKSDGFVERNIGNEKVVVPISNNIVDMNCVYTMNEVGGFIYSSIDGNKTLGKIFENILEVFEVAPCLAQPDFDMFIAESIKNGLLSIKK